MSRFSGQCDLYDEICMCEDKENGVESIFDCFNKFAQEVGNKFSYYDGKCEQTIEFTKFSDIIDYLGCPPAVVASNVDDNGIRHTHLCLANNDYSDYHKGNLEEFRAEVLEHEKGNLE